MKSPKRQTLSKEYSIEAHKDHESPPTFSLKSLSVAAYDSVTDLIAAQKGASALRLACKHGVVGWSYEDEFTQRALEELDPQVIYELGGEILRMSSVSEDEKN